MINLKQQFSELKSVLCLHGDIPSVDFFKQYAHLTLVAADGAGSDLIKAGIVPQIIVGDLDSLQRDAVPKSVEVIQISEQITTDFDKCLKVISDRNLFPCLVTGITGKESDHTLYNLQVMARHADAHTMIMHDSAFKTKNKFGIFVKDQLVAAIPVGANISFFAFEPATMSSKGLQWELDHIALDATTSNTRNAVKDPQITITVHEGTVLVLLDT